MEVLKQKNDGIRLSNLLDNIKKNAIPFLSEIIVTFPEYTPHDIKHSENILSNLGIIIPDPLKEILDEYEIYFLIASAYLHDIGMRRDPTLEGGSPEEIRAEHHLRSETFILKNYSKLGIEDIHQAKIIGIICKGHRKEDLSNQRLFDPDYKYKTGHTINTALLAAFLRLGDELDLTFERIPLGIYEISPPKNAISKEEWDKHVAVSGIGISSTDQLKIIGSAKCTSPRIHWGLKEHEKKINEENMRDLSKYLHTRYKFSNELPRAFEIKIDSDGYIPRDFKFTIENPQVIISLMGERLYKRKEACLREILKNSVDACRHRQEIMTELGEDYRPNISFSYDANKLIIKDNGTGIDEDNIKNYLTKIGSSFYKSHEFKDKRHNFNPLGELGIGILSCFMIANRMEIDTKAGDDKPLLLEIYDIGDYFFVKDGNRRSQGTTITLYLKDEAKEIDIIKELKNYARHIEFPIYVYNQGKSITIEDDNSQFEYINLSQKKYLLEKYQLKESTESKLREDIDFNKLIHSSPNFDITMYIYPRKGELSSLPYRSLVTAGKMFESYIVISTSGILINVFNDMNKEIFDEVAMLNNIIIDINIKADIVDIDASRDDFIYNKRYKSFLRELRIPLAAMFMDYLTKQKEKYDGDIRFNDFLQEFFSDSFRCLSNESYIKNIYYKFCPLTCITDKGIKLYTLEEIVDRGYVIMFNDANLSFDEKKLSIIAKWDDFDTNTVLIDDARPYSTDELPITHKISEIVKIIDSHELEDYLPDNLGLIKVQNYNDAKLIISWRKSSSDLPGMIFLINRDNKFIDIIIKNKCIIFEKSSVELKEFFECIGKMYSLFNVFEKGSYIELKWLQDTQKSILKYLKEAGLVEGVEEYILSEDDFPWKELK